MGLSVGGVGELAARYDVVVIGSGYGGGAAALRLAERGRSVVVLERGDAYEPGDFPATAAHAARSMQITRQGKRRIGSARALLDFRVSKDVVTLVGCGVGGTSLINANVALRADPAVLADPRWPVELAQPGALDEGYARAESVLDPQPYPAAWPVPAKRVAFGRAATVGLDAPAADVPLYISFATRSEAAIQHEPCTGCGDCVTGCNVGAKRTVDRTYLAHAQHHGAAIIAGAEANHVRRAGNGNDGAGWIVVVRPTGKAWPDIDVLADTVVIAAGALGSTELLARSRAEGLWVSPRLGTSVSGNGDHLAYAYDTDLWINGVGRGSAVDASAPVGPCIIAGTRTTVDGQGILIEDGSLPKPMAKLAPLGLFALAVRQGHRPWHAVSELWRRARRTRPAQRTLVSLAMGIDDDEGMITLPAPNDEARSVITWPHAADEASQARKNEQCRRLAEAIGGDHLNSPVPDHFITVHPLGGAAMADDPARGVVDHRGAVYSGDGTATHPGLYVMDGSIIPTPVGTNPSLTIAALAERALGLLIGDIS